MSLRLLDVFLLAACSLAVTTRGAAEGPLPDLKPLHEEVQRVVRKHYPEAKVTLQDQTIRFEFKTRKFWIHEPLLTGEWQDAHEDVGPQKGGIHGVLELRAGEYGGMAALPQSFDKRYFTLLMLAPDSRKLDAHLSVRLKYPRNVSPEFLKEFTALVNQFEQSVAVPQ